MRDMHDLEKRWLHYKVKSFIPHVLISLMIIISFALVLSIYSKQVLQEKSQEIIVNDAGQEVVSTRVIQEVKVKPIKPEAIIKEIKYEANRVILQEQKKMILSPSLDFIKSISNGATNSYQSEGFSKNRQVPQRQNINKKIVSQQPKEVKTSTTRTHSKPKKLLIQRQETQADINHVIKRFQKNNNPALSLFIAKKYFKLGDYKQSYNYALLTNQINNEIDQSWIIFSKSLVKLGKRDKAIDTLQSYIQHSKSSNAKILLDNIKSGKFK